jgi:hypothetical protein
VDRGRSGLDGIELVGVFIAPLGDRLGSRGDVKLGAQLGVDDSRKALACRTCERRQVRGIDRRETGDRLVGLFGDQANAVPIVADGATLLYDADWTGRKRHHERPLF